MPGGRPTDYKEEYCQLAKNYALLGATDVQLAKYFDVVESTIYKWKEEHPEFSESIRSGGIEADAKVAQATYHRALGYSHEDTDIRVVGGEIVETPITKHYPPESKAAIFWLRNRQRKNWPDLHQVTGADEKPLIPERTDEDDLRLTRKLAFILSNPDLLKDQEP